MQNARTQRGTRSVDRKSFMLGMITAFAECVAGEAKRLALSPPFYASDSESLRQEADRIAEEQGIYLHLEKNPDLAAPLCWYVMYKFPDVLEEYQRLRSLGHNPALHFEKFASLLGYGMVWGNGAEKVTPRFREKRETKDSMARLLLNPEDWPVSR
jgi:hypothetical protein